MGSSLKPREVTDTFVYSSELQYWLLNNKSRLLHLFFNEILVLSHTGEYTHVFITWRNIAQEISTGYDLRNLLFIHNVLINSHSPCTEKILLGYIENKHTNNRKRSSLSHKIFFSKTQLSSLKKSSIPWKIIFIYAQH